MSLIPPPPPPKKNKKKKTEKKIDLPNFYAYLSCLSLGLEFSCSKFLSVERFHLTLFLVPYFALFTFIQKTKCMFHRKLIH